MCFKKILLFKFVFLLILTFKLDLHASEKSTYNFSWLDPDKEVYVLQNRKYRKAGRFHVGIGGLKTLGQPFVDAYALQGRGGFFLFEEWGMELLYSKNYGDENAIFQSVKNPGGSGSTPFRRITDEYVGGMVLWSPFYAKVNTFNKIIYVDWIIGIGAAQLTETNNREAFDDQSNAQEIQEKHLGVMWGMGLKFYINRYFSIKADLLGIHYRARRALTTATVDDLDWYDNYDLGASILFDF